jgi:hypothetical protein
MQTATVTWDNDSHDNMTRLADKLGLTLSDLLATIAMSLPAMATNAAAIQWRIQHSTVSGHDHSWFVDTICTLLDHENLQSLCDLYNPTQEN